MTTSDETVPPAPRGPLGGLYAWETLSTDVQRLKRIIDGVDNEDAHGLRHRVKTLEDTSKRIEGKLDKLLNNRRDWLQILITAMTLLSVIITAALK